MYWNMSVLKKSRLVVDFLRRCWRPYLNTLILSIIVRTFDFNQSYNILRTVPTRYHKKHNHKEYFELIYLSDGSESRTNYPLRIPYRHILLYVFVGTCLYVRPYTSLTPQLWRFFMFNRMTFVTGLWGNMNEKTHPLVSTWKGDFHSPIFQKYWFIRSLRRRYIQRFVGREILHIKFRFLNFDKLL